MEVIEFRNNEDVEVVVNTRDENTCEAKKFQEEDQDPATVEMYGTDGVFSSILLLLYSSFIKKSQSMLLCLVVPNQL